MKEKLQNFTCNSNILKYLNCFSLLQEKIIHDRALNFLFHVHIIGTKYVGVLDML